MSMLECNKMICRFVHNFIITTFQEQESFDTNKLLIEAFGGLTRSVACLLCSSLRLLYCFASLLEVDFCNFFQPFQREYSTHIQRDSPRHLHPSRLGWLRRWHQ